MAEASRNCDARRTSTAAYGLAYASSAVGRMQRILQCPESLRLAASRCPSRLLAARARNDFGWPNAAIDALGSRHYVYWSTDDVHILKQCKNDTMIETQHQDTYISLTIARNVALERVTGFITPHLLQDCLALLLRNDQR